MKLKNIIISFLIVLLYNGCDKIEGPYREAVVVNDFCTTGIEDSIPSRKVLVEDYTGHLCGNCPAAGVYLNDTLKALYGHCLVVISVHAGFFAGTCPTAIACPGNQPSGSFTTDFTTPAGNAWNTFFGITGNPKGMINRIDYPGGTHSKALTAWSSAVASELAKPVNAKVEITNTFNVASNSVSIAVKSDFLEDLPGDYKLQVVITEDNLIDWQVWYNHTPEFVPDYVHHHVLRDVVNSTWGEDIATGGVTAGTSVTKNYTKNLNSTWVADECNIVAFIYKSDTYEVIEVSEKAVK